MIGIVCFDNEKSLVKEFFELFKIHWEFYRQNTKYEVVLSTGVETEIVPPDLLLVYSSKTLKADTSSGVEGNRQNTGSVEYGKNTLPLYGGMLTYRLQQNSHPDTKILLDCVYTTTINNLPTIRIGYDLFQETGFLLTKGQPANRALVPTLELHISILRELVITNGIPIIEIPPVPSDYSSITCLTHDVDFVRITDHKFDSTMLGFVYRALFGSIRGIMDGRGSFNKLLKNWAAVLSLPGVYLGVCKDFLNNIKRYLELEKGLVSTFFLIPFKNCPGHDSKTRGSTSRSVKYDIGDIKKELQLMLEAGCEIGLHGIDAWTDTEYGEKELLRIKDFSKTDQIGIRMHWLYFDQFSPENLEKTGFLYDSTMGYNEAIGFKCGTAQVFRFTDADKLSELPLIIQDTALFYPDRMNLKEDEAWILVKKVIQSIEMYGGVITINWHQRSLGPERQWGNFYTQILNYLKQRETWFAGGTEAAKWFAKRKTAAFVKVEVVDRVFNVDIKNPADKLLPAIKLRVYKPVENIDNNYILGTIKWEHFDVELDNRPTVKIPF